ncbi:hypothetical protein COT49_03410 [candidate division WWE3 bacterium CG08_land_8_20_14_0_20_40_13]|uniref:Glycosyl transferase family 1 domain-containing protein n=1 Tax=candidate division WWE3 bacterium CG08_land_8_20_14_0_20_40_13 TaxID=1975084 RepID=A0A2H0XCZ2_UNCKA|nr:MAG: hypothetical protein COT49_03410 [candidate division WWE3 bacterium CG08_land_8_20_14_0_20_40_13]
MSEYNPLKKPLLSVGFVTPYPPEQCGVAEYSKQLVKNLQNSVKIKILPWKSGNTSEKLIRPIREIGTLAKAFDENDIVHIQYEIGIYYPLFLLTILLTKKLTRCHTKIVVTAHESYARFGVVGKITLFMEGVLLLFADAIIVHSTKHQNALPFFVRHRTTVIPIGVENVTINITFKKENGRPTILIPGFINRWKGYDIAVEAMPLVLERFPNALLMLVGRGDDLKFLAYLDSLIKKGGLQKNVAICNKYISNDDLDNLLRSCKLVALPYRRITNSALLAKAIAFEKPTVISDLPELLGYYKTRDSSFATGNYKSLASIIIKLLEDHNLYGRIQDHTKTLKALYLWRNVANTTVDLYWSLLETN